MSESSDPQSTGEGFRQASQRILSGSVVVNTIRTSAAHVERYVRRSFLYRWLTAEPDPEVIVIDLRETWTVGPILAIFERLLVGLHRAQAGSRVGSLLRATTAALRASPIRVLGAGVATIGATLTIATLLTSDATTRVVIGLIVLLVGVIATRDDRDWETLRETQFVVFLRRVLEPPASPADGEHDGSLNTGSKETDQVTDENGEE